MSLLLVKLVNLKKLANLKSLRPVGMSVYASSAYKVQITCSKQFTTTVVMKEKGPTSLPPQNCSEFPLIKVSSSYIFFLMESCSS